MLNKVVEKYCVLMRDKYGWKVYQHNDVKVWFCGYQYNCDIENLLSNIPSILHNKYEILKWIRSISGHFAIVIESNELVIAAVDRVCTIPVFVAKCANSILISNHAPLLKKRCYINDLNLSAGLEISMSGYTIGSKTLYKDLDRLEGGECVIYSEGKLHKEYYYTYSPWKTNVRSRYQLKKEFTDVCINSLTDLKNSANGRQIVIPLSAGNDSRLIASGLKELGVKNIICFSYGRKGNFETPISRAIAEKLGYKWLYIPTSIKNKGSFFKSDVYKKYTSEFESYGSISSVQEIYEVSLLKKNSLVDKNAIIVNGNSGDFISGGHVNEISDIKYTPKNISEVSWDMFLNKHYSLWGDLRTEVNDAYIVSELKRLLLSRSTELIDFEKYHYAIMESLECIGRQSRYVIEQQRTYEYFGYDWRLPLWSNEMLNFWEKVPREHKVDQNLYIETLHDNNWGGVWSDIKINNKKVNPHTLRLIRILLKTLSLSLGRSNWHKIEKNMLEYFMHPSNAPSAVPYLKMLFDRRGFRNTNSWLSEKMLNKHKLSSHMWKEYK
jgi:asparagine synthase (glutamine-hydrolysing)